MGLGLRLGLQLGLQISLGLGVWDRFKVRSLGLRLGVWDRFRVRSLGLRLSLVLCVMENWILNVKQLFGPHKDSKTNVCLTVHARVRVCKCVCSCGKYRLFVWFPPH